MENSSTKSFKINKRNRYQTKLNSFFSIDFNYLNDKKNKNFTDSVEYLKKSKQLILNSKRYIKYNNYYNNLTTSHTFKLPNIDDYPLRQNTEIIPIKNHKKEQILKNLENVKSNHKFEDLINNEKENNLDNNNIENSPQNEEDKNTINPKSFLTYIDKFNNMNSVIYKYITYKENYFIDKKNSEIIDYFTELNNNLNDLENFFNSKNIVCKENKFDIGNINIKMIYNSLILYIFNEKNKKIYKFKFPFKFLSFFYSLTYEDFKIFLINIITYNTNKKNLIISKKKIIEEIQNFKNRDKNIFKEKSIINKFQKYSSFTYNWLLNIDNNMNKYKLVIKMPHIKMRFKYINKSKITIYKTFNIKYVSYLIKENYKDWDLFSLNSLCIYKDFRDNVNQALSYNQNKIKNKYINLDDIIYKLNSEKMSNNSLEFFATFENDDNFENIFVNIISPSIAINFKENGFNNTNYFKLKFKEAIQLNKMRESFEPEEMINRCAEKKISYSSDKKTKRDYYILNLNENIFSFDESILKYIKKEKSNIYDSKNKQFIQLYYCNIEWANNINPVINVYTLEKNEYEQMLDLSIKEWDFFILKMFHQIQIKSVTYQTKYKIKRQTMFDSSNKLMRIKIPKKVYRHSVSKSIGSFKSILNKN